MNFKFYALELGFDNQSRRRQGQASADLRVGIPFEQSNKKCGVEGPVFVHGDWVIPITSDDPTLLRSQWITEGHLFLHCLASRYTLEKYLFCILASKTGSEKHGIYHVVFAKVLDSDTTAKWSGISDSDEIEAFLADHDHKIVAQAAGKHAVVIFANDIGRQTLYLNRERIADRSVTFTVADDELRVSTDPGDVKRK